MNSRARLTLTVLLAPMFLHVTALAADVSYYGILKVQEFVQTPAAAPVPATDGYSFHAFVVASTNGAVTNATVRRVGTATDNVLLPRGGDLLREFEQRFASQAALDSAYPNGNIFSPANYAVTMFTVNEGVQAQNLNFAAVAALGGYPATPQIADLAGAQMIDPTRDFTLRWNSLGGGTTEIVQLTVFDSQSNTVFSTPAPFQPDALNASSVSATIPANTLPPGATLAAHLTIARPGLPNTTYATGVPAFSKDTSFPLSTLAAPARPTLTIEAAANGAELSFSTEPARVYHLQASPELVTWSDILVTNAVSSTVRFVDTNAESARFYRVQVGP